MRTTTMENGSGMTPGFEAGYHEVNLHRSEDVPHSSTGSSPR